MKCFLLIINQSKRLYVFSCDGRPLLFRVNVACLEHGECHEE